MGFGGIISSESKARLTTNNRQIGVQGDKNVSISDKIGNKSAVAIGGVAVAPLTSGKNSVNTVTVNNTSPEAWEFASNIGIASLASQNQVSLASINAANQLGINALGALREGQMQAAESINYAVGRSFDIAESAAPVSEAAAANMLSENIRKILIGLGIVIVVGIGIYYVSQSTK